LTVASTTVELGVPGPHDVPGASRARRNSPSPCPGTADVVEVAGDVEVLDAGVVVLAAEVVVVLGMAGEVVEVVEDVEVVVAEAVEDVVTLEPANPWP
jgi:hypothetical protein